jgi:hypothetical protein
MDSTTTQPRTAKWFFAPGLWLLVCILLIALVTSLGPAEKSLGVNVRVVYLHGAWVWTAMAGFVLAALVGLGALVVRRTGWYTWCAALGRTGLFFWITYLPISLWAMQANWNGLFLAEPRWRLAAVFAVTGLLLQAGLAVIRRPQVYAWGNIGYITALLVSLRLTEDVLHPNSPIFSSDSARIQVYFLLLLVLTLAAGWQLARILRRLDP